MEINDLPRLPSGPQWRPRLKTERQKGWERKETFIPKINPELSGIIMEINDLREFGWPVFVTRLLPQENARNTKTRGYVNCFVFFCDLCAPSRPFVFG